MKQWRLQLAAKAIAFAVTLEPSGAGELALRWLAEPADPARAQVEVSGLDADMAAKLDHDLTTPAQWQRVLAIRAEAINGAVDATLPAMAGSYRVADGKVSFTPLFPVVPGVGYVAVLNRAQIPGQPGDALSVRYRMPQVGVGAETVVAQVYPTAATLPENLLKFYVHFSAPMSRGHIYEHIHLLDAAGKQVELPFLELDEELWNPAMTRLTLFIDPGRIKRGVRPLEEIGPALVAGEEFRLVIDRSCRDAAGHPLAKAYEKRFTAGPAEREPLDPSKWKIQAPSAGTRDPLRVDLIRPLDHAITQRVLRVVSETSGVVAGIAELEDVERTWKFVPALSWSKGVYQIVIPTAIEDLAGNNVGKPFDVDLGESSTKPQPNAAAESVKVDFVVR